MLNEALASRRIAIDRSRLVASGERADTAGSRWMGRTADSASPPPPSPIVRAWPPDPVAEPEAAVHRVPKVIGLGVRDAVHRLHQHGYQVSLRGDGARIVQSAPAVGESVRAGRTVIVWTN